MNLLRVIDNADKTLRKRINKNVRRRSYISQAKEMFGKDMPPLSNEEIEQCKSFWSKYPVKYNMDWCRFYKGKTGEFDPRFIPNELEYADIDPYLNNWDIVDAIDDKNYYSLMVYDAPMPNTVLRIIEGFCYLNDYTPVGKDVAFSLLKNYNKLIFKKSVCSFGGYNIAIWDSKNDTEVKLKEYFETAISKKNYVVQEFLTQSEKLSKIHSKAVNTIRINTLIINHKVHYLAAILKMGADDMQVDNVHWGGCSCGITEDGKLKKFGSDAFGNNIERHPSGFVFDGFEVPGFQAAKELVMRLHERFGRFRLIGWDIAIDENDMPVLIEFNLKYPAIEFQQWNNGPFFGKYTEAILDEVYLKEKK